MGNPVIKQIEQKEHKISNKKITELRDDLDYTERGVCMAATAVCMLTDTRNVSQYGEPFS